MVKRCVYCSRDIDESSALDVCVSCGHGVWGEKMFQTIVDNMGDAKEKGDLFQGSVGESQ